MIFKNTIFEETQKGPDHMVMRQSEFRFWRHVSIITAVLFVYCILLYWGITILPGRQQLNNFGTLVWGVVGWGCLIMMILLFGLSISLLINYFYTVYMVDTQQAIKIKYGVNFESEVTTVDLKKVLFTNTDQGGFFQSTFDYGDIHLHLQSDDELILENIPKPKECIMHIEKLQKYRQENDERQSIQDNEGASGENEKSVSHKTTKL